jgi:hypothetical protein
MGINHRTRSSVDWCSLFSGDRATTQGRRPSATRINVDNRLMLPNGRPRMGCFRQKRLACAPVPSPGYFLGTPSAEDGCCALGAQGSRRYAGQNGPPRGVRNTRNPAALSRSWINVDVGGSGTLTISEHLRGICAVPGFVRKHDPKRGGRMMRLGPRQLGCRGAAVSAKDKHALFVYATNDAD